MSNPNNATVRRTLRVGQTVPQWLTTLDGVVATAATCTEVQNDPVALAAYNALKTAVATAHTSQDGREKAALALAAAIRLLHGGVSTLTTATRSFETSVAVLAKGNAALITKAGLTPRDVHPPPAALEKVSVVHCKPGNHPCESIVSWPEAAGATAYAIEVNFTPQSPTGTYTALNTGTSRRRTVKGPTPGCQFLVRIAAQGSDGTQADWSDAVLATAL